MLKCTQAALCNITALQGYILYVNNQKLPFQLLLEVVEHAEEKDLFIAF